MQLSSSPIEFETPTGITLRGDVFGDTTGSDDRHVVLLHGGGQTRHAWRETSQALAERGFQVIALDLRGHGESDWASDADYTLDAFVADLRSVVESIGGVPSVVGASLGGITALLTEGESEHRHFKNLVLVDVAPRIEAQGVARIIGFMTSRPEGFESVDEAAAAIAEYLPHRPPPSDLSGLAKNLVLGEDGRYRWHWDPAFVMGGRPPASSGQGDRLRNAAAAIDIPTLLVRGKISDLLSAEGAAEFLELVPHAKFVDVAGAGHMVAGDSNSAFAEAVVEFLNQDHS
ncbi:MAG: alpha/beta hydrolase [Acidobacteria bacterium]|nr:MAG: alpha/beta hydrolase [Acidobacteriota bacterium]